MKATKQELEDFRSGQKALRAEIKRGKKALSRAKKTVRQEETRIRKLETAIGKHYYREYIRGSAGNPERYERLCRRISDSKEALQAGTSGRDALTLQIAAARQELKDRKRAFRAGPVPEIILE